MLVTVDVPLEALGLFDESRLGSGVDVEFERTVTAAEHGDQTVVVTGGDQDGTVAAMRDGSLVGDVTVIDESDDRLVCRVTWRDGPPELFESARNGGGTVLSATATGDAWTVSFRFPDRTAASRCLGRTDGGQRLTVRSISQNGGNGPPWRSAPTPAQQEALRRALAVGYYDVPRRTSLLELAEDLDISDTAASERLRRGTAALLQAGGYA